MSRLYRPHIPLDVRCAVALRQLGELWPNDFMDEYRRSGKPWAPLLDQLLGQLSMLLGAEKLHLDHDPPLAARPQFRRGLGRKTYYEPDANDPEHLIYREEHAHRIKTNVRGDGAQYPDRVLIKRERRRHKPVHKKPTKWAKQKLRSANRWPPKGMRKIQTRQFQRRDHGSPKV